MKRDEDFYHWVSATLSNDENSSDRELAKYFMEEGKMSVGEAWFYVKQRQKALSDAHFELKRFKCK